MFANSVFGNILPFCDMKPTVGKLSTQLKFSHDSQKTFDDKKQGIISSTSIKEKCVEEETNDGGGTESKRKIFKQCEIVLDLPILMGIKEKQQLRKEILNHGGTISYMVTKNSSFLVHVGSVDFNSTKFKMAAKYGIPIVTEVYVRDCLENQKLLDAKLYLIVNQLKTENFQKGKILVDDCNIPTKSFGHTQVPLSSLPVYQYEGLENYEIVKAVVLKGRSSKVTSKSKNPINFYILELHAASEGATVDIVDIDKMYCVFTEEGYLENIQGGNIIESNKLCYFLETPEKVLAVYSQLYFSKTGPPHYMKEVREVLHPSLGTPKFQKLQLEWSSLLPSVDTNTLNLVNLLWTEAIGHLNQYLIIPPESVPLWKVDEAESILLQISSVLEKEKSTDLAERLSGEFYSVLPHKPDHSHPIITKKLLAQKKDLCQVLRDMLSISESTGWSPVGHLQAKYRALCCYIQSLSHDSEEYSKIDNLIIQSQSRDSHLTVENIFLVHRDMEFAEFTQHIPNKCLLFHSTSPANLVGILSRGLNLPKIVIAERGIDRFDVGMLGGGIYFTDSASTCIRYSKTNKSRNTRFLLVSEVALGNVYKTNKFQTSLTEPPEGYDSIHGVKSSETEPSDFQDNEFVIYNSCQQCINYLVEFSLPEDKVLAYPCISDAVVESNPIKGVQDSYMLDITNISDSVAAKPDVKGGLKGMTDSGKVDIPLKSVHVAAHMIDLVAQVTVVQEYHNINPFPIEGKYIFPLEANAAVCGFEAFIKNKHVIGIIKEKEIAHKEYKEAISKGHGAYLMDEESPNVFTVSVGNIPAATRVVVKITYILELPVNDEIINFNIPGCIAPWHQTMSQVTQDTVESIKVGKTVGKFELLVSIDMPFPIANISSPTHRIQIKRTEMKAVVQLSDEELGNGFTLHVSLKEIHVPRFWVECHPEKSTQACMLTFYPEFEVKRNPHTEIIIAIDASNSMKGEAFQMALQISMLSLTHLPHNCYFNIVAFGTVFQELFPASQIYNAKNRKKAEDFLKHLTPTFGNTELSRLLRYYQLMAGSNVKNVIVISDGHINNEGMVLRNAEIYYNKVRIFTIGVSPTVNKHILCQLANRGGGAFEYIDPVDRNTWKSKVTKQIERTMQVALTNVNIEWQVLDDDKSKDSSKIVQAPQQIMCIFNGCRQVVYGFISDCSLVKLLADIDGQQYETVVYTSPLNKIDDTMLHTLAARAVIRDWEDGLLAQDRTNHLAEKKQKEKEIIEYSKEYNLVTSLTSFIAVEKRDEGEDFSEGDDIFLLDMVLDSVQNIDILPFMEFEGKFHLEDLSDFEDESGCRNLSAPDPIFAEDSDDGYECLYSDDGYECLYLSAPDPIFAEETKDEKGTEAKRELVFVSGLPFREQEEKPLGEMRPIRRFERSSIDIPEMEEEEVIFRKSARKKKKKLVILTDQGELLDVLSPNYGSFQDYVACDFRQRVPWISLSSMELLEYDDYSSCGSQYRNFECFMSEDLNEGNVIECSNYDSDKAESDSIVVQDDSLTVVLCGLRNILKCKGGGLPFCNSLWNHIELMGKEDDELREFLNSLPDESNIKEAPSFDFSDQSTEHECIKKLAEILQCVGKNDGFGEESDCIELDILEKPFMPELEEAGLKSLGEKIFENIRRMLATLSMFAYSAISILKLIIKQKVAGVDEFIETIKEGPSEKNELEKLDALAETIAHELTPILLSIAHEQTPEAEIILRALKFVITTEKNYPLVYHSLGIGSNWEVFVFDRVKYPTFSCCSC